MNRALIIIDMQMGFRHAVVEPVIEPIRRLGNTFPKENVFATQFYNLPGSAFVTRLDWHRFMDEADQAQIPELDGLYTQAIRHPGYTTYTDELKNAFKAGSITAAYITGVFTDVCVIKTAMDMFDDGVETFVVEDAVATLHGRDVHEAALKALRSILGATHVNNTQAVLNEL